jgi:hypothetical protein
VIDALDAAMAQAIEALDRWPARTARLFHHNDADGLSAGAILSRGLTRAGYRIERCCLEKPYPPVLETIFQDQGALLIFADFAGRIAPLLSEYNRGRNLILILDHHPARPVADARLHHLNPELFGYRGERDMAAATTCYRFANHLSTVNRDLAYLAVTGAVGDGFSSAGRLANWNRWAADEAVQQGQLTIRPRERGEDYLLQGPLHNGRVSDLAADLDMLGGAGFFQGGPETGIRVCLEGFDEDARRRRKDLAARLAMVYAAEIDRLRSGEMQLTGRVQWFQVHERFEGLGVKMIGDFCRHIRDREFIMPGHYIAGFQPVPELIPGLGRIAFKAVKVSMRVPALLEGHILAGTMPGLDQLLPKATRAVGGFADACHRLAAATTVPPGQEAALVATIDALIADWPARRKG